MINLLATSFPLAAAGPILFLPLVAMLIPMVIVPVALYFKYQRQRLWHETARIALEKGQPLPVDTGESEREAYSPRPRNDLRTGLILIAVSVGLSMSPWRFSESDHFNGLWFGSAIPGCIGVALLLNALITALFTKKTPSSGGASNTPLSKP